MATSAANLAKGCGSEVSERTASRKSKACSADPDCPTTHQVCTSWRPLRSPAMNKDSVVVLESSSLLHPPASPYQRFTVSVVAVGASCRTLHVVTKETTEVTAVEEETTRVSCRSHTGPVPKKSLSGNMISSKTELRVGLHQSKE